MRKLNLYLINPKDWNKQKIFGFFRFKPCTCGCTKYYGWGFNFFIFGFNISYLEMSAKLASEYDRLIKSK